MFNSLQPHVLQHTRLLCPPLSPGVFSNFCPLSWWCYLTISSSAISFSFCLQSFRASGSFPLSWLFASGDQSIGAPVSATVLSMNIQGWFPLGFTGLIALLSKGLSRVFSSTTVWKHQFFSVQSSLWSSSHIHTRLLEEPCAVLNCSVMSNSWTAWTVARQAPLFMGILQVRIVEWAAMPFSRGSFQPRDQTQVSHISGGFFTVWATRGAHMEKP